MKHLIFSVLISSSLLASPLGSAAENTCAYVRGAKLVFKDFSASTVAMTFDFEKSLQLANTWIETAKPCVLNVETVSGSNFGLQTIRPARQTGASYRVWYAVEASTSSTPTP